MKKFLLFIAALLFSSLIFGQSLNEGFETWPPSDWTIVQGPCSPTNDITQSSTYAYSGTYSARFSSYYSCGSGYDEYLITPQLVVTSGDQTITFWYRRYSSGSETFRVGWSSTGTNVSTDFTWTADITNASTTWQQYSKTDLPVGTKYVAIHYKSSYDYYLYIDDVVGPTLFCPSPSAQTETNITSSSVDLGWTENGTATTWIIEWGPQNFTQGSGTTVQTSSNPHNLSSGLSANTPYDWYVRAYCGVGDTSFWVGPSTFTTLPTCPDPTAQTETNITTSSVDLGWTENGTATTWIIEWGPQNFTQGSGTTVQTSSNPYNLSSGLSHSTSYDWYMRAFCGVGDSSFWVGPSTFTTLCGVYDPPYTEDFNGSYPPNCWFEATGDPPNPTPGSSPWHQGDFANNSSNSKGVKMNVYGDDNDWFISPRIDLGTGNKQTTFMVAATGYNNMNPVTMSSEDTVFVMIASVSAGVINWDLADAITYYTNTNTPSNTGDAQSFNLTGWTDTVRFAFYTRGSGNTPDMDIHFDDFVVQEKPACQIPIADSTTNITATSAKMWWTEIGTATKWDIIWDTTGFDPLTEGTLVSGIVNEDTTLSPPFTANATYDWYVRSDCGAKATSAWSVPKTFTTLCNPITTFPYNEGFENAGNIPDCWSQEYRIGTNDWVFTTGVDGHPSTAHGGTYNAAFEHSTTGNATKLVTPELDLSSLTTPRLKFWRVHEYWSPDQDTLRIYYKTSAAGAWTMIPGAEYYNDQTSWTEETLNLPSPSSTYFIAFEGIDGYGYGVGVDDVTVEEAPACLEPTADSTTNITITSAKMWWTENGTATKWDIIWDTTGFDPLTEGTLVPGIVNEDTTLSPPFTANATYDWYVRADCGAKATSTWAGPKTFTTLCGAITTFPWTEDFTGTQNCWTVLDENGDGDYWNLDYTSNYNSAPEVAMMYTDYNAGSNDDYMITPQLTLPANQQLVFWYRVQSSSEPNDFEVLLSTTGNAAANFTTTLVANASYSNTTYLEMIVDLSAYSGNVYIAWRVAPGGLDGWRLYIDDVTVEVAPTCPAPSNLTTSNIAPFSANLGWTDNAGASSWEIEWGSSGFSQGTGTLIIVATNPYTLNPPLTANTPYDWYVRAICGVGDTSTWSGPATFTTPDMISIFPYNESFETDLGKWYQSTNDDFDWTRNSGGTTSSGTGPSAAQDGTWYMYTEASGNNPYFTAGLYAYLDFSGFTWPQLEFYYNMLGVSMGSLYLMVSTDNADGWDTVWSMTGDQGADWHKASVALNTYAGDTVKVKFTGLTGNDWSSDIAIDNITVIDQTDPIFSITPDSLDYGECPLNNLSSNYYTQTFTVQNIGPGTITVTGTSLTGGDVSQFQLTDTNAYNVALSGSNTISVDVKFAPTTTGDKTTTLRVVTTAKVDHDVPLLGQAYVAPPQNLTGETTLIFTNELDWDPPLPENEIRYDNGVITNWYWVADPSGDTNYFYTRFTAPVTGNLDHVSLYTKNNAPGADWNEIMVCPDNGSGAPDLGNPYETFSGSDVVVNSTTGEWLLLQLTTPEALTQGTDFFMVTRWPDASTDGPFVGTDATHDFGRCAWKNSSGTTWNNFGVSWIMRAYMSTSKDGPYTLTAGDPVPETANLEVLTVPMDESQVKTHKQTSLPVPGVWTDNGSRAFVDYSVHRGPSSGTYDTHFTGVANTNYTDNAVTSGNTYFYAVTANYSASQVSDTTNEISLTVLTPFSGTKTIGSTGDYLTLTDNGGFFEALNNGGVVTGNLNATILEDITEPGTHALNEVIRSGGNHVITIEPDLPSKASITVSGNVSGAMIKFNGADYVTVTGANNYLAFVNTATSGARVFEFANGASHNTITGCDISTGSNTSTSNYCIYSNGAGNDTNTLSDNHLMKSYYGIYLYGNSSSDNSGNVISGNIIGEDTNAVAGMDSLITKYGIYANYQTGFSIFNNEIKNLIYSSVPYGIYILNSNYVSIFKNYIHDIVYTGSGGYGPLGIYIDLEEYTPGDANSEIYNNIIRHIAGDSDRPSLVPAGIRILGGSEVTTGIDIYYNSIYLQPDTNYGMGDYDDPTWCAGIIIDDGPIGINLVDNIFYNSLGERKTEPTVSYGSAVWCKSTTSPFATIDYNLYYADTSDHNFVGMSGTTTPPTTYDLAGWQTFTGQDHNSVWGDPLFTNDMLGLTNPGSPAIGEGTPLSSVTDDYNGTARHAYYPTMGALEYVPAHVAIWTGNVSTDWNNTGNWGSGTIPDQTNNIAIPTTPSGSRFPVILSGVNAKCKKLIVDPSATIDVQSGGTLTVDD